MKKSGFRRFITAPAVLALTLIAGSLLSFQNPIVSAQENKLAVAFAKDGVIQNEAIGFTSVKLPSGEEILGQLTAENFKVTSPTHETTPVENGFPGFKINGKAGTARISMVYTDSTGIEFKADKDLAVTQVFELETVRIVDLETQKEYTLKSGLKILSDTDEKADGRKNEYKIKAADLNGDPVTGLNLKLVSDVPAILKFGEGKSEFQTSADADKFLLVTGKVNAASQSANISITYNPENQPQQSIGVFPVTIVDKIDAKKFEFRYDGVAKRLDNATEVLRDGQSLVYDLSILSASNSYSNKNIPEGGITAASSKDNIVKWEIADNKLILTGGRIPAGVTDPSQLTSLITVQVEQLGQKTVTKTFSVRVDEVTAYIMFEDGSVVLPRDSSKRLRAYVKTVTPLGEREDREAKLTWDLSTDDARWVSVTEEGSRAIVTWKTVNPSLEKSRPGFVTLTVNGSTDGGKIVTAKLLVSMVAIDRFAFMKVKLNPLDRRTVRDLFGSVTDEEYYVVAVRMFNNLKDEKTDDYLGASIIVYNGSLEVGVLLQKQYDKDSNSGQRMIAQAKNSPEFNSYNNPKLWFDVNNADFQDITADHDYTYASDANGNPITKYKVPFPDSPPCTESFSYRPLTFEMAVNSVDPRDERRLRSRVFAGLSLAGTLFSTANATGLATGNSVNLILDRYSNLLVPGLEKVFPSLKEVHRQNLVSMGMKPIEEVAFGTDVNRVIFIPKKAIYGVLKDHRVRISQICPFKFKVEVAVIRRGDKAEIRQGQTP